MRKTPANHRLSDTARMYELEDEDERPSGRSLLETAFQKPDVELLKLASRTETALGPQSEDPISVPNNEIEPGHSLPRLPLDAPEWMLAARELSLRLERAIARGRTTRAGALRIQRAVLAFSALDSSNGRVFQVAHLVRRAHHAIRETQRAVLEPAVRDCAEVIYGGLSPRLRQNITFEAVLEIVRELHGEADPWVAVVSATSALLGWRDTAHLHAAEAIRAAIEEQQQKDA